MAEDKPPMPRGGLAAALALLALAAGGVVLAVRHTTTLLLVCGIGLFACGGFLGVVFLYAWFKSRR